MKKTLIVLLAVFTLSVACFYAEEEDYVDPLDWGMTSSDASY